MQILKRTGALLCAVLLTLSLCACAQTQAPAGGTKKTVTVTVENPAAAFSECFVIETEAEFLRGALEQEDLIAGSESQYGLFVTSVCSMTADESREEWWCFTKGGEVVMTGVDSTPIADGEHYEFVLKTGY